MTIMAERAFISRATLGRVERGEPSVSLGIYATVLFVLGMTDRLAALADPTADRLGLMLDEEQLPKRIRLPKRRPVT
jgi:transcriptional regulator with XRE-family HTH domain